MFLLCNILPIAPLEDIQIFEILSVNTGEKKETSQGKYQVTEK